MSYTKRQFIEEAFEEIGLGAYSYDLQPEDYQSALKRMDSMLAVWNVKGVRIGYPLPSSPEDSDLDQETNVPDGANLAITTNLALGLAGRYGKIISQETKQTARSSYRALSNWVSEPPKKNLPGTMPRGAGQKPWRGGRSEFLNEPADPVEVGGDGILEL